jgi:hypothetical protein
MVVPMSTAIIPSKGILDALNNLILKDRPKRASLQTALSKLAIGWLQRHFDALLQAGDFSFKAFITG